MTPFNRKTGFIRIAATCLLACYFPQSSSASTQITTSAPALQGTYPNLYSPSAITIGGTLYLYYGGWAATGQTNDDIYVSACPSAYGNCSAPTPVFNTQALGFRHLNDPTVVQLASGSYIMYLTGVEFGDMAGTASWNHVYYSTSADGLSNWTAPKMLSSELWEPSAVIDKNNHVLLYANSNITNQVEVYDLGINGIYGEKFGVPSTQTIPLHCVLTDPGLGKSNPDTYQGCQPLVAYLTGSTAKQASNNLPKTNYQNVSVSYRPSLGKFEMLAEIAQLPAYPAAPLPNQIDYLTSTDGINWTLPVASETILRPNTAYPIPAPGVFDTIRTPAPNPTTDGIVYYAQGRSIDGQISNQMSVATWGTTPAITTYPMASAVSNSILSSPNNAVDGNTSTFYSSQQWAPGQSMPYLAAYMTQFQTVNAVTMTARALDALNCGFSASQSTSVANTYNCGFPAAYNIYVTDPTNHQWNFVKTASYQPDASGVVVIPLGGSFVTLGVMIVPTQLGLDNYGNPYLQVAEIALGNTTAN